MQISALDFINDVCLNLGLNRYPLKVNFLRDGFFAKLLIVEPNLVIDEDYVTSLKVVFVCVSTALRFFHFKYDFDVSTDCRVVVSPDVQMLFRNALNNPPIIFNISVDKFGHGEEPGIVILVVSKFLIRAWVTWDDVS